jgi:hypothetical protein
MPIKRPKRPRDPAQLAKLMIDIASGEVEDRELTAEEQGKNPAAVALGKRGGLKGGTARAKRPSAGSWSMPDKPPPGIRIACSAI